MPKLNNAEQRILRNPPTTRTWVCGSSWTPPDGESQKCGSVCPGYMAKCWLCGAKRPSRPKLLYPLYVAACKKAKIEPGTRWPVKAASPESATVPKRNTKRKGA